MNRKIFLTTGAVGFTSLCITPVSSMSVPNTATQTTSRSFLSILEQLEKYSLHSMSTSFNKAYETFMKQLNSRKYQVDPNTIYRLNDVSYVMPMVKSTFITKHNYLVLFIKGTGGFVPHILDNNMLSAYDEAIKNYNQGARAMDLDLDVLKFVAPTKVLKRKKNYKREQFAFQNSYGNTLTLISTSNRSYMTVC